MNRILRLSNFKYPVNQSFNRLVSSKSVDQFHHPDATPEEVRLVNERVKLRKALRAEYLRKATDPHSTEPVVFDPVMQRYYAMHMTLTERFIPTFKNWCEYMITCIIPIVGFALLLKWSGDKHEKKCRTGEIEYKDRLFKYQ
ncbi:complex I-B15 [Caerostris extrusa]|uniref:NADH dehydrogenase [ubiquinone] 1 beta subcomplex subunit 4 n=1 Tax=Caerostris extrusa TaxID=172846 RepID=A0AAV4X701_CAEEX|nr:complex I-B15 [Caerostris extrusa]